jgi:Flp pilus assembly protein TadD
LVPAASAERWIVERAPVTSDSPADSSWLPAATELLLRNDLAELKGVVLLSKSDVRSDIATLELNRLSSATGDKRLLLGKFARAKGLIVIDPATKAGEVKVTAIDLTQGAREQAFGLSLTLTADGLEGDVMNAAQGAAKFLGREATKEELARMKRLSGLKNDAFVALAKSLDAKSPAERELLTKQASALANGSALAWYLYARELHAAGKTLEAISAYRSAVKLDGARVDFHYDLGNAFFDDKRYDEAQAEYGRAIALDPTHAESHENLARALKAQKLEPADVLAQYRKLVEAHDSVASHVTAGRLLVEMGKFDDAVAEFRKACDLDRADAIARFDLAHALDQGGKENEAFYEYKEALNLAPNYAKAFNNLGFLYEKKEKLDLALYYYQQAVKYAPDYALAWNNLGILYGKRGNTVLEVGAFRMQTRLTPKDPVAWYNLGVGYHHSGEMKNAIDAYKRALELKGDDKPTRWQLAHAYERDNTLNLANDQWRKILELNPTDDERKTAEKHLKANEGK